MVPLSPAVCTSEEGGISQSAAASLRAIFISLTGIWRRLVESFLCSEAVDTKWLPRKPINQTGRLTKRIDNRYCVGGEGHSSLAMTNEMLMVARNILCMKLDSTPGCCWLADWLLCCPTSCKVEIMLASRRMFYCHGRC